MTSAQPLRAETLTTERIRRLEANGGALDEKITHYEKALGEQ